MWGLIVAAVASVGAVLCTMYDLGEDKGYFVGRIIMASIAEIAVSISFAAIYVYSAELFPTVVRYHFLFGSYCCSFASIHKNNIVCRP